MSSFSTIVLSRTDNRDVVVVLTSREFLYHLPCESSARKLDSFGSGWQAPETAVRTDRVVVNPPAFDDDLGFFQRVEQFPVEKLIAHLAR